MKWRKNKKTKNNPNNQQWTMRFVFIVWFYIYFTASIGCIVYIWYVNLFVYIWYVNFFLGFWDATSYLMSPGESLKDCPSSNCRTYLLHTLYTAKYQLIYCGITITKKFIDVQYQITYWIDRITGHDVTYTWNCHFQ